MVINRETVSGVDWYYIQYKISSGYKNGFIKAQNIHRPNYGYVKPISTGKFTNDYKSSHDGVDIAGNNINVVAAGSGTLSCVARYKMPSNNKLTFVSFGRHAKLTTTYAQFLYGHLSSYAMDAYVTVKNYAGVLTTYSLKDNNSTLDTAAESWSPGSGHKEAIAKLYTESGQEVIPVYSPGFAIGKTGWTGYVDPPGSGGAHLHFQVLSAGSGNLDPFNYVLFPGVCYLGSSV